jgi:hypothetical protein
MTVMAPLGTPSGLPAAGSQPIKSDQPATKPDCIVSDVAQSAKLAPTTIALETRKAIFIDLQQAVARAQQEAAAAYPIADGGALLSPASVEKDRKLAGKREGLALALERTYLVDVLKARLLTCEAAREITREGRAAKWPSTKP